MSSFIPFLFLKEITGGYVSHLFESNLIYLPDIRDLIGSSVKR